MLCFLHIPKCGGTTIRKSIDNTIDKNDPRKTVYCYQDGYQLGRPSDINLSKESFKDKLSGTSPSKVNAIIGHYTYQLLSEYLGTNDTYKTLFSLTRNPIDRLVSHINHIRSDASSPLHDKLKTITQLDLYESLEKLARQGYASYQYNYLKPGNSADGRTQEDCIEEITQRVCLFKLSSMASALHARVSNSKPSKRINPLNSSSDLKKLFNSDHEVLSTKYLPKWQLDKLKDAFMPDFLIWEVSR